MTLDFSRWVNANKDPVTSIRVDFVLSMDDVAWIMTYYSGFRDEFQEPAKVSKKAIDEAVRRHMRVNGLHLIHDSDSQDEIWIAADDEYIPFDDMKEVWLQRVQELFG